LASLVGSPSLSAMLADALQCTQFKLQRPVSSQAIHFGSNSMKNPLISGAMLTFLKSHVLASFCVFLIFSFSICSSLGKFFMNLCDFVVVTAPWGEGFTISLCSSILREYLTLC